MDSAQSNLEQLLQEKCPIHKFKVQDLIDLTGNSENGRVCFVCAQQNGVNFENLISIEEVFATQTGDILSSFPPLKNKKIKNSIEQFQKQSFEVIEEFFKKLKQEMEEAISVAEAQAKKSFIQHEAMCYNLYQEWSEMAEIEKLKKYLLSDNKKLNEFLNEKWSQAESNAGRLNNILDQINNNKIDFNQKNEEIKKLIQSVQKFDLFKKQPIINNHNLICSPNSIRPPSSIIKEAKFISSTFRTSSQLTLVKPDQLFLLAIYNSSQSGGGDAFLNFILKPTKKYLIRLNYQPNSVLGNYFYFGLTTDDKKYQDWCPHQNMAYCNSGGYGITEYIKGQDINSDQRQNIKESFEVRISLNEKILKVATYPDYSSILELDDANKIDPQKPYRFFIHIANPQDILEIGEIMESDEFIDSIF